MRHHRLTRGIIYTLMLLPSWVMALDSDRDQPINIEADHAQLDDKLGVAQYKGRAILTQGTLRIEGDIITFYYDENSQITKMVAEGNLAKYQQVQNQGEEPVKAQALKMEYFTTQEKIYLSGESVIWQNGNRFNGNRIQYDISRNIVNADARPVIVANKMQRSQQRVHFIFDPNKKTTVQKQSKATQDETSSVDNSELSKPSGQTVNDNLAEETGYPITRTLARLNIRTGPGDQYKKIATLTVDSELIVLTEQNEWLQIRGIVKDKAIIGWVNRQFVLPNTF